MLQWIKISPGINAVVIKRYWENNEAAIWEWLFWKIGAPEILKNNKCHKFQTTFTRNSHERVRCLRVTVFSFAQNVILSAAYKRTLLRFPERQLSRTTINDCFWKLAKIAKNKLIRNRPRFNEAITSNIQIINRNSRKNLWTNFHQLTMELWKKTVEATKK